MGRIVPFRRSGGKRGKPSKPAPAHWRGMGRGMGRVRNVRRESSWGEAFRAMRPVLLLIALVTVWLIWDDPARIGAPDLLARDRMQVEQHFALCDDAGYAVNCVVDGDTIAFAGERIRVAGIDTAEMAAGCEAEAVLARQSALALQDWLNRGAFTMQARWGEDRDRYGRLLRTLWRARPTGSRDDAAVFMQERGGARGYDGGGRTEWC